jgi:hypothetical protein
LMQTAGMLLSLVGIWLSARMLLRHVGQVNSHQRSQIEVL